MNSFIEKGIHVKNLKAKAKGVKITTLVNGWTWTEKKHNECKCSHSVMGERGAITEKGDGEKDMRECECHM